MTAADLIMPLTAMVLVTAASVTAVVCLLACRRARARRRDSALTRRNLARLQAREAGAPINLHITRA